MNNSFQIRYLWMTILALLLLNLGLLGWIWFSPQGQNRKQPPPDLLVRELNLNPQQKKQYLLLRDDHHAKTKAIRDSVLMLKRVLFHQIGHPLSDQDLEKAVNEIANKMAIVDTITFKHFRQVRQLCTPPQQQRFDEIIDDVLGHLDQRPRPRQDGPPPRD